MRPSERGFKMGGRTRPHLSDEREALVDINTTPDHVTIVLEMPGAKKRGYKNKRN